jgi:allantoate deiminase
MTSLDRADCVIRRCRELAEYTDEPGRITRTFLSPATHLVHGVLSQWMQEIGLTVALDNAGNLRGLRSGSSPDSPLFLIGSHIDTVPDGGAFDGVLGVILALALLEALQEHRLPFAIEAIAFSEEEGVRFGVPFIGSRAVAGTAGAELLEHRDAKGTTVAEAIRGFGLDPAGISIAAFRGPMLGYLEFHIEQGPVLESLDLPLGIVESIAGQTRYEVAFEGRANHAGTTPVQLRRDALAGAAEWIGRVERTACTTPDLRATVGFLSVKPGAANVIPGNVRASLDVRHSRDDIRQEAVALLLDAAAQIGARRGLDVSWKQRLEQPATPMDTRLVAALERAVKSSGYAAYRMISGAGHDAMIMEHRCPAAMLFVRSPGGISHHPAESVLAGDVAAALDAGVAFLRELEALHD